MTIQLSVEEALEYQKFEAELVGFSAGVASALDHFRRQKINAIIRARQAAPTATEDQNSPNAEAK